ncbi:hypothetical protein [Glycomyces buryatensis]|uniref:hypothetical protein n=1 Tax=Glycomyces buryatensis TaxID=2570927 RepID=UPI0014562C4A|nr:hypothetical protein [Glycomyces buryatensis]
MNFEPPPQPPRPSRRKPLLITVIVASWCIIAASATTVVLTRDEPAGGVDAAPDDTTSEESEQEEPTGPLAAELLKLQTAFAEDDRDAWTAMFSGDAADRGALYFDNLQALEATSVKLRTIGEVTESGTGTRKSYSSQLGLSFCLNPADAENCTHSEVDYHVMWSRGDDGMAIDLFQDVDSGFYRPQGWEEGELQVAVGDRVTVAASADAGIDPADYLDVAESAAQNADEYALLAPVDSYLVMLATDDEFNTWYGGYENEVALGNAPATVADVEASDVAGPVHVMVPFNRHDSSTMENTLRHELGHAATLQGADLRAAENEENWWMYEGIAEYIANGDQMPGHRTDQTKVLVAGGGCSDGIEAQTAADSADTASGKYGCAYLGVRYMVDEYGIETFLNWFQAVHHQQGDTAAATEEFLGTDYESLKGEIASYISGAL